MSTWVSFTPPLTNFCATSGSLSEPMLRTVLAVNAVEVSPLTSKDSNCVPAKALT